MQLDQPPRQRQPQPRPLLRACHRAIHVGEQVAQDLLNAAWHITLYLHVRLYPSSATIRSGPASCNLTAHVNMTNQRWETSRYDIVQHLH